MPATVSNQRLGPVGQYSSKHPRDVFHPWRQNGYVAMGTSVNVLSDRQQLAVTIARINSEEATTQITSVKRSEIRTAILNKPGPAQIGAVSKAQK